MKRFLKGYIQEAEQGSKTWNSGFGMVSGANFQKILLIFVFFLWKICILRSKIADFGVILSDFIVNYDILADFQGLMESAWRAPRRSDTQNCQNEAIFKRKHIWSWAGLENLKFWVCEGIRSEFPENIADFCVFWWKIWILRSKIADLGVILSDFLINYNNFVDS